MTFEAVSVQLTVGNEEASLGAEEASGDPQTAADEREAQLVVEDLALVLAVQGCPLTMTPQCPG